MEGGGDGEVGRVAGGGGVGGAGVDVVNEPAARADEGIPGAEREGAVFYNTTRADWVDYRHIQPTPRPGQSFNDTPLSNPEFRRERFGAHYSMP